MSYRTNATPSGKGCLVPLVLLGATASAVFFATHA